jgi:hypothetical protein
LYPPSDLIYSGPSSCTGKFRHKSITKGA